MIGQNEIGQMITVLGLSYVKPLFPLVRLSIVDIDLFRDACIEAIKKTDGAYYDEDIIGWIVDRESLAKSFVSNYNKRADKTDVNAFRYWVDNGFSGIYTPDLLSDMWMSALQWVRINDIWHNDISSEAKSIIQQFTVDHRSLWNDPAYIDAIDEIRDYEDTDQDLWIKMKMHVDFYDEYGDPLLILDAMRKKHTFIELAKNRLDDKHFVVAMNHIPRLWHHYVGSKDKWHNYLDLLPNARIELLEI